MDTSAGTSRTEASSISSYYPNPFGGGPLEANVVTPTADFPVLPFSEMIRPPPWLPDPDPNWVRLKAGYSARVAGWYLTEADGSGRGTIEWYWDRGGVQRIIPGDDCPSRDCAYRNRSDMGKGPRRDCFLSGIVPEAGNDTWLRLGWDGPGSWGGTHFDMRRNVGRVVGDPLIHVARLIWYPRTGPRGEYYVIVLAAEDEALLRGYDLRLP